jgi:hypothetical protein
MDINGSTTYHVRITNEGQYIGWDNLQGGGLS